MFIPVPSGVSAAFAVKLFKSWINEKDINSVAASLRKVGMDNRLMVRFTHCRVIGNTLQEGCGLNPFGVLSLRV